MSRLLTLVLLTAGISTAGPPPDVKSPELVKQLTTELAEQRLEAVAALDPDEPDRFVAALFFPDVQLLVISARHTAPEALAARLAQKQYREVYLDLSGTGDSAGSWFLHDMQADGLRKALKLDEAFDSTSVENGAPVSFDGKWEAQKLTEEEYSARFAQDDERYARMLGILRAALARKTT